MRQSLLSASKRIHRVFHRLGVVIGGVLVCGSLIFAGVYIYNWLAIRDVRSVVTTPNSNGNLTRAEESELRLEIRKVVAIENAKARVRMHEVGTYSVALLGSGLLIYVFIRGVGWIVAGAVRD